MTAYANDANCSPVAIAISRDRRRSFHRDCCVTLLRRYFNVCAELGRLPSLLGREVFRARTSSRRPASFENGVIFSIDVERCLELLDEFERQLIARLVLQEHSEEEAARLLHCCRETISRRLPGVLDKLADIFIERKLLTFRRLRPVAGAESISLQSCAADIMLAPARSEAPDLHRLPPVEICCQAPAGDPIHVSV